jgi:hypothetical protein
MRGELTFESHNPEVSATAYAKLLGELLREALPRKLEVNGTRVFVHGGIFRFVSNWNVLIGVTTATIVVVSGQNRITVQYDIALTEMLAVCGTFTGILFTTIVLADLEWPVAAGGLAMIWGWLFNANYLTTRFRMRSLFKRKSSVDPVLCCAA